MSTQLMKGNAAVIVGALYGGCDCYFGYPITPASEILQEAAERLPPLGRVFVQAESEEAAINMVYGAAAAGHRVLTSSSGPGISLKQEAVSYMAGAELPCVIVDIMRAGPGLGNIGPEQSDYNQIVKGGGHGNYRAIVLAPNSVQEMCDFTARAFELSQRYRTPVYVLADGVLGQLIEPIRFPKKAVVPQIDRSWAVCGTAETTANMITSIILDFDKLEAFNNKLQEKYAEVEENEVDYETSQIEDADIVVVAYGIVSRVARTAVARARSMGIRVGLFRPKTLFPFPNRALRDLARGDNVKFVCVELSNGQMRDDIRLAIDCSRPVELVSRMGGRLVTEQEILSKLSELVG